MEKEQACFIKQNRCFNYKKRGHTTSDYSRKGKIVAILDGVGEYNNSQDKK